MKVLQINNVFNSGSTGKITADIHSELLENGIESIVCYGRGKQTEKENVYKVCSEKAAKINSGLAQLTGIEYIALPFSLKKVISIIKKEKPDIVHLQCINGFFINIYALIRWLNKNGIKTVMTLHAEFMFTANCPHSFNCVSWQTKASCRSCNRYKEATHSLFFNNTRLSFSKLSKSFEGFGDNLTVVSVSPWLCERSKKSYILGEMKNIMILNGIDTDIFKPCTFESKKERKTVLHVTAKFSDAEGNAKGGSYIIALAERMPDVDFTVVAKVTDLQTENLPENIKIISDIGSNELARLYSASDLSVITSRRETFSMPVAESLCCGTPVVGFRAGGPEAIAIQEYSEFADYGDINGLEAAVRKMLSDFSESDRKRISESAASVYSKNNMTKNYISVYKELLSRKQQK